MTTRRPFVGGNWKMNLTREGAVALARALAGDDPASEALEVALFPAFVHLDAVGATLALARSGLALGAQDCYPEPDGAFTGEVSIPMLGDLSVSAVLVGHSERRHIIGEPDDLVARKCRAVLDAGLTCVLCVGETLDERQAGLTDAVNERQARSALQGADLDDPSRLVVAYEPVWAIGTGRTATPEDAQEAHARLRAVLSDLYDADTAESVRIIYGGSVKPGNAAELFSRPGVDGGLIGGASLDARGFLDICAAARGARAAHGATTP
ncbi:MAG: triose-phosphate isomerase [Planctomycetota bacterium]|nr:MAG: triose-phosphate isomerase [Planctomycetota bacterium]